MDNKFTPEQLEKLKACKTAEEVAEFIKKENIKLTDAELDAIAGGAVPDPSLNNTFVPPTFTPDRKAPVQWLDPNKK